MAETPNQRRSFLWGAMSNWLVFAATLAVSFFLTPFLIHTLGKPRYDVWCVVEAILAYFTLLDFGIAACLVRYVARMHAQHDNDGLNRFASSSLAIFLTAGITAVIVGIPLLWMLTPSLEGRLDSTGDVLPFMILMLINLALTLPLSVFPSILDGLERYPEKSVIRLVGILIRTAAIVLTIREVTALTPLAIIYLVVNLAEHGVMMLLCRRYLPMLRFSIRSIDRQTLREVRTYSTDAFLALLAGRITLQTGAILIGIWLPAGQVTYFTTAARLVDYAKTLLRTITATLSPGVSAMEARGDHAAIARLYCNVTRWLLYLVLPVHAGLILFGKPFLERWVGSEFVAGSYPALVILAGTLTLGVAQSVASRILYGLGRLRWFARAAIAEAVLNLGLTALLIQPLGVEGVAWSISIPNLVFNVFVIVYTCRELNVGARIYLKSWVKPCLCIAGVCTVWTILGPADAEWLSIAWHILTGMMLYSCVVFVLEKTATPSHSVN